MTFFLKIQDITKHFGGLKALDQLSLLIKQGEIHALIGPNGSGKSTLLKIISGIISPSSGQIVFEGHDITGSKREHLPKLGIAQVCQGGSLFKTLSVIDNILAGMHSFFRVGLFDFFTKPFELNINRKILHQRAMEYLDFAEVDPKYRTMPVMETSYAVQRHVELARAIASEPRFLMLDEPVAGLNDIESQHFKNIIIKIRNRNVTILLVEHDMKFVKEISDQISVLNFGRKIAEGSYDDIRSNSKVVEAYLGKGMQ